MIEVILTRAIYQSDANLVLVSRSFPRNAFPAFEIAGMTITVMQR